jgi:hypothetical protein
MLDEQKFYVLGTGLGAAGILYEFSTANLASNMVATNAEAPILVTPDGSAAIYRQRGAAGTNVVVRNLGSGEVRPLVIGGETVSRIRAPFAATADGRFVVFAKPGDPASIEAGFNQIYLYDLWLTNATLLSGSIGGGEGNGPSASPSISADGRTIVFDSLASDLVAGDRNDASDVFVARLPAIDANNNGLEDGWEARFLPPNTSATADSDNDGASNQQEYMAGTDPASAASVLALESSAPANETVQLSWGAVYGRTYQVQHRASLTDGQWANVGAPMVAVQSGVVTTPAPAAGAAGFYRIVVVP